MRKLFKVILASLFLVALSSSVVFAQDPDNGKVLWEEQVWQCQACHGTMGEGMWGPPVAGSEKSAQEWIDQVRNPRRFMPTFSEDHVTDEQLTDMHAYISSLPEVTSFTPSDAGLAADAPEGQQLIVEKRCVACHSTTGPIDGFIDRGEVPTAERVINQLRDPFNLMPSFSEDQVSDAEATLIAEFMASEVSDQTAPGALPQAGHAGVSAWPMALLLTGGILLLTGLALRRFLTPTPR